MTGYRTWKGGDAPPFLYWQDSEKAESCLQFQTSSRLQGTKARNPCYYIVSHLNHDARSSAI